MAFNSNISNFTTQQVFDGGGGINNTPSAPSTSSAASTSSVASTSSKFVGQMQYDAEELRDMAMFLRKSNVKETLGLVSAYANDIVNNAWQGADAEEFQIKINELMKKIINMVDSMYTEISIALDKTALDLENKTGNIITGIAKF